MSLALLAAMKRLIGKPIRLPKRAEQMLPKLPEGTQHTTDPSKPPLKGEASFPKFSPFKGELERVFLSCAYAQK